MSDFLTDIGQFIHSFDWLANYIYSSDWLTKLIHWALSFGILAALWELVKWFREIRHQRGEDNEARRREENRKAQESYKSLEDKYFRFLELQLQYPDLGTRLYEPDKLPSNPQSKVRKEIIWEMLLSIFERVYLEREVSEEIFVNQWPGWKEYILEYLQRKPSLRELWNVRSDVDPTGYGLDLRFQVFMDEILAKYAALQSLPRSLEREVRPDRLRL